MNKKGNKRFTILGTSIWKILTYFIIYSFIGYIIETLFGILFYNVLESRQSFVYGPFCAIYGVGAVFIYVILNKYFKKSNYHLFIGGIIVGSIIEYLISYIGETFLNIRWWDYSGRFLNINGRVCLLYSIFWGLLAVYFMKVINPKIDKILNYIKSKINIKVLKTIVIILFIFLLLDCGLSIFAERCYILRQVVQNDLDIPNKQEVIEEYNYIYSNEKYKKIIYKYFDDKKMVLTYPNLTITLSDGSIIKLREFMPDIKPYYYKFNIGRKLNETISPKS